jgi:hypothetical protein
MICAKTALPSMIFHNLLNRQKIAALQAHKKVFRSKDVENSKGKLFKRVLNDRLSSNDNKLSTNDEWTRIEATIVKAAHIALPKFMLGAKRDFVR